MTSSDFKSTQISKFQLTLKTISQKFLTRQPSVNGLTFRQRSFVHFFVHADRRNADEFKAVDDVDITGIETWIEFRRRVAASITNPVDGQQVTIEPADVRKVKVLAFRKTQFDSCSKIVIPLKTLYKKRDAEKIRTTFNEVADLLNRKPSTQVPADQHLSRKCMRSFFREFLLQIAKREQWHVDRSVQVGDECIMFEKDVERRLWKKAIVAKIHPGKDGIVSRVLRNRNC